MELQLTAAQHAWREEVRDFLDTELPDRFRKSTEWCEDEDFWAFAIAFTRKVSARGRIGLTWPAEYGGALLRGGTPVQKRKFLPPTWGSHADLLYCAARTDPDAPRYRGITIFGLPIDQPGVTFGPLFNIGGGVLELSVIYQAMGRTLAPVPHLESAVIGAGVLAAAATPAARDLLEPVLDRAAVLRAAQIQGAAERLLELSVDYAAHRTQFGQAIGRYQAVPYLCSDIAINSHLTSLMVRYAAGLLDAGLPAAKAVSQAKAQASLTARLAPERAHAVHAGIAFVLDFDVQLFTRRCRHWELDVGDERYHRERIAAALAA